MIKFTFSGMATGPSLAASKSGNLQLSLGMIYENGELRTFAPISIASNDTVSDPFSSTLPFPILQFGMVKVGNLSISDSFSIPSVMAPANNGIAGSGANIVHSTTTAHTSDLTTAANTVYKAIAQAISQQIEATGCFFQPFYLRYAIKMTDGSHQCLSAPVLMAPWALPPCVALASNVASSDGNTTTVNFSGASFPYFKLACLVRSSIPTEWLSRIAGVDVYVSAPILTYNPDIVNTDGLTSYLQMAQSLLATTDSDIYAGTWSDDNGASFTEHTLQECGLLTTRAWAFSINTAYHHQLTEISQFWKVAFIPASKIIQGNTLDFNIATTDVTSLKKSESLTDTINGHLKTNPVVSLTHCDRIFALGGRQQLMSPLPICSSIARCNDSSLITTYMIAKLCTEGKEHQVSTQCFAPDLTVSFPRFLFMPILGAYSLTIIQNSREWTLPLTPHSYLSGTYWQRSQTSSTPISTSASFIPDISEQWIETKNVLRMYDRNQLSLLSSAYIGSAQGITILPTIKSVSQGQFGQYPLYVFCTDGVWAVPISNNTIGTPQLISTDQLTSAQGAVLTPEGVAYATNSCVKLLSGAKAQCISHPVKREAMSDFSLPHWPTILQHAGITCALPSLHNLLDNPRLHYDDVEHRLWLWSQNFGFAMVYSFLSEMWAMCSVPNSGAKPKLVATGPIETNSALKDIKICGLFQGNKPQIFVYGSPDLQAWTLVASGEASALQGLDGTAYRYYIATLIPGDGTCLYSAELTSSD